MTSKLIRTTLPAAAAVLFLASAAPALQITHGPYLVNQTETGVTVMWYTDVRCRSSVEYGIAGNFSSKVDGVSRGIWNIGTRHEIRLTGLTPGQTYDYRAVSTEVTAWLAYYSTLGSTIRSANSQFTAFNKSKTSCTFYFTTDILSDANRMNTLLSLATWTSADFAVFGGDVLADLTSENTIFSAFVDPVTTRFAKTKPIVFVRGNQEMNGGVAPKIFSYLPTESKEFYHAFSHGPAHFLVFDCGQDSADATPRYGGLMRSEPYRAQELAWFQDYVQANSAAINAAPFKIALAHQPNWGVGNAAVWDNLANSAGVKLLIAGHSRTYAHAVPAGGRNFHVCTVGQDQLCRVTVSATQISVTVQNGGGTQVDAFTIDK
jgi:hypothetical protein